MSERQWISAFASWAASGKLQFSDLALQQARLCLLDTLACIQCGSKAQQTQKILHALETMQQQGSTRAFNQLRPFSLAGAAMINGAAAHAIDFDDHELHASTHPSAVLVSALLAMVDLKQIPLTRFLNAYLVGYEAIIQTGNTLGYEHYRLGWHATSTIGPLAAAAACSYFLGHNADQIANAMAIASSQAAGLQAQFGSDMKAVHAGLAARAGVEACLFARAGIRANLDLFEAPRGFFKCYGGNSAASALCWSPGQAMDMAPVTRKLWPCCGYTHRAIEAALRLSTRLEGKRPRSIKIRIAEPYWLPVQNVTPHSPATARFSLAWCVASALANGKINTRSFTEESILCPETQALLARVRVDTYPAPEGLKDISAEAPETVSLQLDDGSELSETIDVIQGSPQRPMSEDEILSKLCDSGVASRVGEAILDPATQVLDIQ